MAPLVSVRHAPQIRATDGQAGDLSDTDIIRELRRLNGTPEAVLHTEELMAILVPLFRADFTVCSTYEYLHAPPLNCPVRAYGGILNGEATAEQLAAWQLQTASTFALRLFVGGHFFLHQERTEFLHVLSTDLSDILSNREL